MMCTVNTTIYEYYCLYENICAQRSSCLEPRRYQFAGNILWRRRRRSPKGIVTLIRCFNNYTIIVRLSVVLGFFSPKTCIAKPSVWDVKLLGPNLINFFYLIEPWVYKDALAEIRFCLSLMSNRSKVVFGCLKWSGKSQQIEIQCAFLFHPPPISNASW